MTVNLFIFFELIIVRAKQIYHHKTIIVENMQPSLSLVLQSALNGDRTL